MELVNIYNSHSTSSSEYRIKTDFRVCPHCSGIVVALMYWKKSGRQFEECKEFLEKVIVLYYLCCSNVHIISRPSERQLIDPYQLEHIDILLNTLVGVLGLNISVDANKDQLILGLGSIDPRKAWHLMKKPKTKVYGKAEELTSKIYKRTANDIQEYAVIDILRNTTASQAKIREYIVLKELYIRNYGNNGFGMPDIYEYSHFTMIVRHFPTDPTFLIQYLNSIKNDLRKKLTLICSIAAHVDMLHENKVYHRNLTPYHVVVGMNDSEMVPALLGFSGSKLVKLGKNEYVTVFDEVAQGFVEDNPYCAPELYNADRTMTDTIDWAKCDAYSLGMIAGYILYKTESVEMFRQNINNDRSEYKEILHKLLTLVSYKPEKRASLNSIAELSSSI